MELKGCNDVLSLTNPMVVRVVHRKYLEAGADIIETNTFNAQRISMADYGLADCCREMNIEAVKQARQCAEEYSTPQRRRLVAGSIGPTSRTTSPDTGDDLLDEEELRAAYREQIEALTEGGVDLLLIETIFDTRNARIALDECRSCSPRTPVMLSFSVATPDGRNMMGQDIVAFLRSLRGERLFSVGINCVTDVRAMTPLVRRLGQLGWRVSIYPNAGLPDEKGDYRKTPQQLVADLWPLLEHHRLNIVGGCCGTNDEHIRMISRAIQPVEGVYLSPLEPGNGGSEAVSDAADGAENIGRSMSEPDASNDIQHGQADDTRPPLFRAILTGDGDAAEHAVKEALSKGEDAHELIDDQMIAAMSEMGRRFQSGEAFVPQLLMSGRAMKRALALLRPLMQDGEQRGAGKVVIGTVKGDLHDIGKNLVSAMLEGCGFEVVDIGIDVSADRFVDAVRAHRPDILCLSALLTTTMGYMKQVIDALSEAGLRQTVKIMVGGAPVSRRFAEEIGADAYSEHANAAVAVAKQLMNM